MLSIRNRPQFCAQSRDALSALLAAPPENPIEQAVAALEKEEYAVAAELLETILAEDDENVEVRFNLAFAYTQLGQDDRAIEQYLKVIAAKPELPQARMNAGMLLLRGQRTAEAVPHFAELVRLRPDDAQANFYWAHALAASGDFAAALTPYQAAIRLDPSVAAAHLELGQAFANLDRLDEAIPHYQRAMELDPELESMQLELAERVERSGRTEAALELFRGYLTKHPDAVAVQERVGLLLLDADQVAEAVILLERAVRESPSGANKAALAQAYSRDKQLQKALALWEQAVAAEPGSADLRVRFANALLQAMQYESAGAQYFQATKIDATRAEAWSGMAFCLYQTENYPAALKALDEAGARGAATPANLYLRAITEDKLQLYEQAQASYQAFLALKPAMEDEVWKSEQRLIVIEKVLAKR